MKMISIDLHRPNFLCSTNTMNVGTFMSKTIESTLERLFSSKNLTDVTLISSDKIPVQAHKFVLSVCSSVLKDLLLSHSHESPIIYLGDVELSELESMLQFMYLGNVNIPTNKIERFLKLARDLHIEELAKGLLEYKTAIKTVGRDDVPQNTNNLHQGDGNQEKENRKVDELQLYLLLNHI